MLEQRLFAFRVSDHATLVEYGVAIVSSGVFRQLLLCSLCVSALQQAHAKSGGPKDRGSPKNPSPITSTECIGLLCDLTPGSIDRPLTAADAAAMRLAGTEKIDASRSNRRSKPRKMASSARRARLATETKTPALLTLLTPLTPPKNAVEVLKQMSSNTDQSGRLVQIGLSGYSIVEQKKDRDPTIPTNDLGYRVRAFFAEDQKDLQFTGVR